MKEQIQEAIAAANNLQTMIDEIILADDSLEEELQGALDNIQYVIDDLEMSRETVE